jgi:hypothetical protein
MMLLIGWLNTMTSRHPLASEHRPFVTAAGPIAE